MALNSSTAAFGASLSAAGVQLTNVSIDELLTHRKGKATPYLKQGGNLFLFKTLFIRQKASLQHVKHFLALPTAQQLQELGGAGPGPGYK